MPDFKTEWLARFGLDSKTWRSVVVKHTAALPLITPTESRALVRALFTEIPALLAKRSDQTLHTLSQAFGWCCFSIWQCESAMPAFPENYAFYLLEQLRKPAGRVPKEATLLARLILGRTEIMDGECGLNRLLLANPEIVRASERLMLHGGYDVYLNARIKYEEILETLNSSEEFRSDWNDLKQQFPHETRIKAIIHRSLLPERNWERGGGAKFKSRGEPFQALFDLFCWKYYLWGMKANVPLLMKPSVVFTPLGTQVFVPGYLSFDAKRDLNLSKIARLHRARGVPKQGPTYAANRKRRTHLRERSHAADREARSLGLKGDRRYEYIAKKLLLPLDCDFRQIRKLLED
jgi:hypothetical protein